MNNSIAFGYSDDLSYEIEFLEARQHMAIQAWESAEKAFKSLLSEEAIPLDLRLDILRELGMTLYIRNNLKEATKVLLNLIELQENHGSDAESKAWSLHRLADIYAKQGNISLALTKYSESEALFKSCATEFGLAWSLQRQAECYRIEGNYGKAVEHLEKTLNIWRKKLESGTYLNVGSLYSTLGDVYRYWGSLINALNQYRQGVDTYSKPKTEEPYGYGWCLHGMGETYRMQGYLDLARQYTKKSITHFSTFSYAYGILWNKYAIAELDRMLGNFSTSFQNFENCIAEFEVVNDAYGVNWCRLGVAEIYSSRGELSQALSLLKEVLEVAIEMEDDHIQGRTLRNIGEVHRKLEQYEMSIKYLVQSRVTFESQSSSYQMAVCDTHLAKLFQQMGDSAKAASKYTGTLHIFEEQNALYHLWRTLTEINNLAIEVQAQRIQLLVDENPSLSKLPTWS